jgi:hypothetical protein
MLSVKSDQSESTQGTGTCVCVMQAPAMAEVTVFCSRRRAQPADGAFPQCHLNNKVVPHTCHSFIKSV